MACGVAGPVSPGSGPIMRTRQLGKYTTPSPVAAMTGETDGRRESDSGAGGPGRGISAGRWGRSVGASACSSALPRSTTQPPPGRLRTPRAVASPSRAPFITQP
jgi:hypothetical protein